jgi:hypothetical protein
MGDRLCRDVENAGPARHWPAGAASADGVAPEFKADLDPIRKLDLPEFRRARPKQIDRARSQDEILQIDRAEQLGGREETGWVELT